MEVRAGYKATEVGVIPENWMVPYLRQHLFQDATYGVVKAGAFQRSGVPMLRSGEIKNGGIIEDYPFISPEKSREYSRTILQKDDVVIALVGYPGETAVIPESLIGANISRAVGLLRPASTLRPDFLASYLNSPNGRKEFLRPSAGSAQIVVNLGALNKLRLPLPSPSEQHAIAMALSDVNALLSGLDRLIAKKRNLKQAAMQQLFTGQTRLHGFSGEWEVKRLGDIGATYGGLTGKTKADFGDGEERYITFMNVMSNVIIDCERLDQVRIAPHESQNRVLGGDLLFNGSSETPEDVAMCSLLTKEVPNLYLNSFCFGFRIRPGAPVDGLFLVYLIRSNVGREVMKTLAQGSTRYNLSKRALLDAAIRLPSKGEQTAIANTFSDMDAELSVLAARRDKTRALKQAIMQELLTGRTRLVSVAAGEKRKIIKVATS